MRQVIRWLIHPLCVGISIFLLLQLRFWNVGINLRDEGLSVAYAISMLHGLIPFRDLFFVNTPGSYAVLSMLMWIWGEYVWVGRLAYVIGVIGYLIGVFFLFRPHGWSAYVLMIVSACVLYWPGGFWYYNIVALVWIIYSTMVLIYAVRMPQSRWSLLAGMMMASIIIFKQSLFLTVWPIGIVAIVLVSELYRAKKIISYCTGSLLVMAVIFGWSFSLGITRDMLDALFIFGSSVKAHNHVFMSGALISIFVCAWGMYRWRLASRAEKACWIIGVGMAAIAAMWFFAQRNTAGIIRYVTDPVYAYYGVIILLCGWLLVETWRSRTMIHVCIIYLVTIAVCIGLMASGKSIELPRIVTPLLAGILFEKIARGRILAVCLIGGTILWTVGIMHPVFPITVFGNSTHTLHNTTDIRVLFGMKIDTYWYSRLSEVDREIKKQDPYKKRRIMCIPYCPLVYPLVEREHASRYIFFYPEIFGVSHVADVLDDIMRESPLILVQKSGLIEPEADRERQRLVDLYTEVTRRRLLWQNDEFMLYE